MVDKCDQIDWLAASEGGLSTGSDVRVGARGHAARMVRRGADRWVPPDAAAQFGVFTLRQASAAGMTRAELRTRVRNGSWLHVAGAGYVAAGHPIGAWERAHAGWLTWPDAVVCLRSAGVLHRFPLVDDGLAHVSRASPRHHRAGLRVHELTLARDDVRTLGRVTVTTPARTAIDLLGLLPATEAAALVGWVVSRRSVTADAVVAWLDAHPGARGNRQRRALLPLLASRAGSEAELLLQQLLRAAGIEGWVAGASLLEHVGVAASVDVYFPRVRLVIEVDGRAAHAARFQSDRMRQNALVNAGCTVLRFTWQDLVERPHDVVAQVRLALDRLHH